MKTLSQLLQESPYVAYTYAYPHKQAYRPFPQPIPLSELWQAEKQDALFLYVHIPFCEMRCGFCNLFTTTRPGKTMESAYLDALWRQAEAVRAALPGARVAQMAVGGGTPTYLSPPDLHRVLDIAEKLFGTDLTAVPISMETSPQTAVLHKLQLLHERGVNRISIGIQSFVAGELQNIGRPQKSADVARALETIRKVGFPTLNVDLIYGTPQQTPASWLLSLRRALAYHPEEVYLYPLYVRPLTGMEKMAQSWDDQRLALYRNGRDFLLAHGYRQHSMRFFRRADHQPRQSAAYRCQEDGMIGLGCGARSYTRGVHYASEYAVGRRAIRNILEEWNGRSAAEFAAAGSGIHLNADEQRRRYLLKSLLHAAGLDCRRYRAFFDTNPFTDFPQLAQLQAHKLAQVQGPVMTLTAAGLAWSDAIGPWFYSDAVNRRMAAFALR